MADKKIFTADTLDDAITKATMELGIPSDRLGYEVLDKGAAGFLGFGRRQASIAAWEMTAEDIERAKEELKAAQKAVEKTVEHTVKEQVPETVQETVKKAETAAVEKKEAAEKVKTTENDAKHFEEGKAFLKDVFEKMDMGVEIDYDYDEEENSLNINLTGREMGVLIGKRGQTLDSLQYLTSLVVNRSGGHYIRVKLDIENYRERREETLENLARSIASKVRKSHKPIVLEPMNPYERRIIHSCLQNDRFVVTSSEGEEPYRHVVVSPKRSGKKENRGGAQGAYAGSADAAEFTEEQ